LTKLEIIYLDTSCSR